MPSLDSPKKPGSRGEQVQVSDDALKDPGPIKNGPRLIVPSSGHVQPMQIDKIREMLTVKTHQTKTPLELFAYSVHDEVDGYVGALEAIEQCVDAHLPGSSFRRVRVFDFGRGRHVGSWP